MKGIIKLINKGMCIKSSTYTCERGRARLIEWWRHLYLEKFEKMAIQISPHVKKDVT